MVPQANRFVSDSCVLIILSCTQSASCSSVAVALTASVSLHGFHFDLLHLHLLLLHLLLLTTLSRFLRRTPKYNHQLQPETCPLSLF